MSFIDPKTFVHNMGVQQNMSVADFGSGAGHFTMQLAMAVGRAGKVYAVDIRQDLLEVITGYVRMHGFFQVSTICADLDKENSTKIGPSSVDIVLCANLLYQLDKPEVAVKEASRILKTGGTMVVLGWEEGSFLSPDDLVTQDQVKEIASKHDFDKYSIIEAGDHHYGLVCSRS